MLQEYGICCDDVPFDGAKAAAELSYYLASSAENGANKEVFEANVKACQTRIVEEEPAVSAAPSSSVPVISNGHSVSSIVGDMPLAADREAKLATWSRSFLAQCTTTGDWPKDETELTGRVELTNNTTHFQYSTAFLEHHLCVLGKSSGESKAENEPDVSGTPELFWKKATIEQMLELEEDEFCKLDPLHIRFIRSVLQPHRRAITEAGFTTHKRVEKAALKHGRVAGVDGMLTRMHLNYLGISSTTNPFDMEKAAAVLADYDAQHPSVYTEDVYTETAISDLLSPRDTVLDAAPACSSVMLSNGTTHVIPNDTVPPVPVPEAQLVEARAMLNPPDALLDAMTHTPSDGIRNGGINGHTASSGFAEISGAGAAADRETELASYARSFLLQCTTKDDWPETVEELRSMIASSNNTIQIMFLEVFLEHHLCVLGTVFGKFKVTGQPNVLASSKCFWRKMRIKQMLELKEDEFCNLDPLHIRFLRSVLQPHRRAETVAGFSSTQNIQEAAMQHASIVNVDHILTWTHLQSLGVSSTAKPFDKEKAAAVLADYDAQHTRVHTENVCAEAVISGVLPAPSSTVHSNGTPHVIPNSVVPSVAVPTAQLIDTGAKSKSPNTLPDITTHRPLPTVQLIANAHIHTDVLPPLDISHRAARTSAMPSNGTTHVINNSVAPPISVPTAQLIDTQAKIHALFSLDPSLWGGTLAGAVVAVDLEGVPSNIFMIQVATYTQVAVFDVLTLGIETMKRALTPLLASTIVLKLFQDLHCDAAALSNLAGIQLRHVLDAQLVAEHLTGSLHPGFDDILQLANVSDTHSNKAYMHKRMDADPGLFQRRPIAPDIFKYAADDVILLLKCFPRLDELLEEQEGHDHTYNIKPRLVAASENRAAGAALNRGKRTVWFSPREKRFQLCSAELVDAFRTPNAGEEIPRTPPTMLCDLDVLLALVPDRFKQTGGPLSHAHICDLVDINLDKGRVAHAYFGSGTTRRRLPLCMNEEDALVTDADIAYIVQALGSFGSDNRAGLEGQLHRISAMRNKNECIYGITMRVGRAISGNSHALVDILLGGDKSILFLGVPGAGKTTMIRDIARLLAHDGENVCIIDTSNEIAGDGDVPHACIGWARRMMVPSLDKQASVMIECVQNHTVGTMIIDEIGRKSEVSAARTVKERGVRVIASAHGDFRTLLRNTDLNGLIGGLVTSILGDEAAKKTANKQKTKTERAQQPTFDVVIELLDRGVLRVIPDTANAVDRILRQEQVLTQKRYQDIMTGELRMQLEKL